MSYSCFIFPRFQNESLDHKYYLCRTVSGLVLCVCNGYEWGSRCCFIWKSGGGVNLGMNSRVGCFQTGSSQVYLVIWELWKGHRVALIKGRGYRRFNVTSEMLEDPLWLFVLTDIISLVTTEHRQHNDECYASANHLSQLAHVSVTFPVRI